MNNETIPPNTYNVEEKKTTWSITDDRRSLLIWILASGLVIVLVPLIIFLVSAFALKNWSNYDDGGHAIAFSIGSLQIAWYGIFIAIGFISAIAIVCFKLWKFYKCSIDPFFWFCIIGMVCSIFGARIWSCCIGDTHWSSFWDFHGGGLAIEGGVVLTTIAACIYFPLVLQHPRYQVRDLSREPERVRQISIFVYIDAIAPAILLGQVIGRYGNYMNGEVYGAVMSTSGGWSHFIQSLFPKMLTGGEWHQPLFFYESLINWCGLIIIYFGFEFIPKQKAGTIGLSYFLWYGIVRLCLEPLRDNQYTFANTYIMSGIFVGIAAVLIILNLCICKYWRRVFLFKTIFTFKNHFRTYNDLFYYLGR